MTTKADRAVIGKAKAIALHRGVSAAELISEILRPVIDKAYAQMLRELDAPSKSKGLKVGALEVNPEK